MADPGEQVANIGGIEIDGAKTELKEQNGDKLVHEEAISAGEEDEEDSYVESDDSVMSDNSVIEDNQQLRQIREAEEDLANNNDPNNNAGPPLPLPLPPLAQLPSIQESIPTVPYPGSPDSGEVEELPELGLCDLNEIIELEDEKKIEEETALIMKLMPVKSYDDIKSRLTFHRLKPSRVHIVLNEYLEEQSNEIDQDMDPPATIPRAPTPESEPKVKNKAGNGLKVKNRGKGKKSGPSSNGMSYESEVTSKGVILKKKVQEEKQQEKMDVESGSKGRKRTLLDLNLESHPEISNEVAKEMQEQYEKIKEQRESPKRLRNSIEEYDPLEGTSRDFVGNVKKLKKNSKPKIELSEDHLHGPYVFDAHRPKKIRQNNSDKTNERKQDKTFSAMRPDLQDIVDDHNNAFLASKSPEVVDLGNLPSPPVVDLSAPDQKEREELYQSFILMFPQTPKEYLTEQAAELVGKPSAIDRFITELLERDSKPPDYWIPGQLMASENGQNSGNQMTATSLRESNQDIIPTVASELQNPQAEVIDISIQEQTTATQNNGVDLNLAEQPMQLAVPIQPETEEEKLEAKITTLTDLFPDTDPEFLHTRVVEFGADEEALNRWINEGLENKGANFPSRKEYEKRQEEAELMQKYSREVTAKEILEMYEDPEQYFGDKKRKVSELYKKHALTQLKKEFRMSNAATITKVFVSNNELYYPSFKELQCTFAGKRKTRRPDHECAVIQEIDINFLKELQFSRIEKEVQKYRADQKKDKVLKIEEAKKKNLLLECACCFNDEVLTEDMLECKGAHQFCIECVQRASEVAIGEGKTSLQCLGQCEEHFELATLQKALKANIFSKWLRKIQLAEVEQAEVDGLERCPFCEFATIMDTSPEENKILKCLNPDCGKESCRLCKEMSHIPLRCEEVEKDAEVRKRTYIENKMTEALIRKCWKCKKPFLKVDGCNKMTCECGAKMCYLCRQPVKDYQHFYGQGGKPEGSKTCPLWSDNKTIHKNDVAKAAFEAKSEMDEKNPEIKLKHDPTAGMKKPVDESANNGMGPGRLGNDIIENIVGGDEEHQRRFLERQHFIERLIRTGRGDANVAPPAGMWDPNPNRDWNEGFVNHMGELLHLRQIHRQQQRDIRRLEEAARQQIQRRGEMVGMYNNPIRPPVAMEPYPVNMPGPVPPMPMAPPAHVQPAQGHVYHGHPYIPGPIPREAFQQDQMYFNPPAANVPVHPVAAHRLPPPAHRANVPIIHPRQRRNPPPMQPARPGRVAAPHVAPNRAPNMAAPPELDAREVAQILGNQENIQEAANRDLDTPPMNEAVDVNNPNGIFQAPDLG